MVKTFLTQPYLGTTTCKVIHLAISANLADKVVSLVTEQNFHFHTTLDTFPKRLAHTADQNDIGIDDANTLLSILTALTIVLGMRMMGAMLISSLIIFPALTAMRLFKSFRGVILCSAVTSVVCFCAGLTISFVFSTPVGATVVAANLALFVISCILGMIRR